jgi:hypothetical protein
VLRARAVGHQPIVQLARLAVKGRMPRERNARCNPACSKNNNRRVNMAEVYSDKGTHSNMAWIALAVIAALVLAIILYAVL